MLVCENGLRLYHFTIINEYVRIFYRKVIDILLEVFNSDHRWLVTFTIFGSTDLAEQSYFENLKYRKINTACKSWYWLEGFNSNPNSWWDEMSIERQKEDKTASKSNKTNYLWDEWMDLCSFCKFSI